MRPDGRAILDIETGDDARHYYRTVLEILYHSKQAGNFLHLLIAGGRKAMSVYSLLAAAKIFYPPHDKVWTVLSSEALLKEQGQFHITPAQRHDIQVVDLPLITARFAPGISPLDTETNPDAMLSRRDLFLKKLSPEETLLAKTLEQHPYLSNEALGKLMHKSHRTIENQFRDIYKKLIRLWRCAAPACPQIVRKPYSQTLSNRN